MLILQNKININIFINIFHSGRIYSIIDSKKYSIITLRNNLVTEYVFEKFIYGFAFRKYLH